MDPLKVPLRVKIYNDKWLRSQATYIHIYSSIIDQPTSEYDVLAFKSNTLISLNTPTRQHNTYNSAISEISSQKSYRTTHIPTLKSHEPIEINEDLLMRQASKHISVECGSAIHDLSPSSTSFVAAVNRSRDKLCFVSYIPSGTMLQRWYLVQLCLDATDTIVLNYTSIGKCCANSLAKHPGDSTMSDELSQW